MKRNILYIGILLGIFGIVWGINTYWQKTYFLSVAAIVKNEKPYLKEWIEYHRLQGVQHFYICDNESTDGTKEYLAPYIQNGLITYIPQPGVNQQLKCYDKIVKLYGKQTEWLAIIDLDEYLVPLQADNMVKFLHEFKDVSEVSLHWMNYGSNHIYKRESGLVTEDFTAHSKKLNHTVKSIVRPDKVIDFDTLGSNHYVKVKGASVNEYHKPVKQMLSFNISGDKARVNHYITKSFAEFLNKKKRGHPEGTPINFGYYFFHNENDVTNDTTMKRFLPKLKQQMKKSQLADVKIPLIEILPKHIEDFYFTDAESKIIFNNSSYGRISYPEAEKIYQSAKRPIY